MPKSLVRSSMVLIFAAGLQAASQGAPLRPYDHTIFWPLKSNDAVDPVFNTKGDGFCLAHSVDKGVVITKAQFESVLKIAFNDKGGICQRDTALEKLHKFTADKDLMKPEINLALLKGVSPTFCQKANWKIVAARFDPCVTLPSNPGGTGSGCQKEFRLVAQPFEKGTNGVWTARDATMHLIYDIPSVPNLVADLKKVAEESKKSEASKPWDPQFDGKNVFRPHHGLRNEMEACGGPVSTELNNFLARNASASKLNAVAWMSSSLARKEWTFGATKIGSTGTLTPIKPLGEEFDNFSDTLQFAEVPSFNSLVGAASFPNLFAQIALVAKQNLTPAQKTTAARTANIDSAQKIMNPEKTSQFSANCTSCHMAPQILEGLRGIYAVPGAVGSGEFKAEVWPPFSPAKRDFVNLHNLSYGNQFSPAINRRTINEVESATKILAGQFP
jgi:hypothetical protein